MILKNNILNILKEHKWVIAASFFVGLVMILPYFLTVKSLGKEYRGMYIMKMDAEEHYLARMQEFLDVQSINNPFLHEGKGDFPSASFTISEAILSLPSFVFPISIPALNLFYKFLLPALVFLLFYSLMFRLTQDKWWSLAFSTTTILGYTLFTSSGIKDLLLLNFQNFPANMYSRPVNPAFSSLLFLIYLHLALSLFRRFDKKLLTISALVLGFSFYIYFYTFTFFLTFSGIVFLILIATKRLKEGFSLAGFTLLGTLLGAFTVANLIKLVSHENYIYLAPISNIVKGREPVFSLLGVVVLVLFVLYLFWKKEERGAEVNFLSALIAVAFVVINQQIVTGINIQEGHYHWYFNTPIYLLVFFWLMYKVFLSQLKQLRVLLASLFIIFSFLVSVAGQYSFYRYWFPQVSQEQRYSEALSWLKENANQDHVVLSNNELSLKIPVYTQSDVSWNYFTLAYLTPLDRTIYALFTYLKLNGVHPDFIKEESYFHPPVVNKDATKDSLGYAYEEVNILLRDYMTGIYPDNMKEMYQDFYKKSWQKIFSEYRLDYVLWDKKVNPNWEFDFSLFSKVFSGDNLEIYKIK